MSLDIDLSICVDAGGPEPEKLMLYEANFTHNVVPMWQKAGVYEALYKSDGAQATTLIAVLEQGVRAMEEHPAAYEALNPPNGWGSYPSALRFLHEFLAACRRYPKATVSVWS